MSPSQKTDGEPHEVSEQGEQRARRAVPRPEPAALVVHASYAETDRPTAHRGRAAHRTVAFQANGFESGYAGAWSWIAP